MSWGKMAWKNYNSRKSKGKNRQMSNLLYWLGEGYYQSFNREDHEDSRVPRCMAPYKKGWKSHDFRQRTATIEKIKYVLMFSKFFGKTMIKI